MSETNYSLIQAEAKEKNQGVLDFLLATAKDGYKAVVRKRLVGRFAEDVDLQISALKRQVEDQEDAKVDLLSTAAIDSTDARIDLMESVDSIDIEIDDLNDQIGRLVKFKDAYLTKAAKKPSAK